MIQQIKRKRLVNGLTAGLMASFLAIAFTVPARAGDGGQPIAFAGIDANGAVTSHGGLGLASASGVRNAAGDYIVTFDGHFPETMTESELVLNSTAEAPSPDVVFSGSSAVVLSASASQIEVEVFTWDSTGNGADSNSFISVFLGATASKVAIHSVNIKDDSFSPAKITINRGQTVRWTNKGHEQHTVTSNPGTIDHCGPASSEVIVSPTLNPGDTYEHTYNNAGTFAYHCEIHGCPMKGTVKVKVPKK